MKKTLITSLLLALASSCAILSIDKKTVKINVKNLSKDSWEVSYKLPKPVKSVTFLRQTNQFREKNWTVVNKDLEITKVDNKEVLVATKNRMFSRFTVRFKSYFQHTPKDYEFFQPFSDGGILFYTGHLYLDKNWNSEVTVNSISNQNIVVMGKTSSSRVKWLDQKNKGTYIYIGNIKPIETDSIIAVIDSGLPTWIRDSMESFLPKLFNFYTRKTNQKLTFKPIVYFNYKPTDIVGTRNSGGTLPGVVQLTVEGKEWARKDKGNFERIVWFLAHEAAHFWNGQMFDNTDRNAAWLHEGGADAFAYRALYQFGILSKEDLFKRYSSALNRCVLGLDGNPLNMSNQNRHFGNYYVCGSTIMLMVESAIRERNRDADLFSFWKSLLEKSQKNNKVYNRDDFHKLLSEMYKCKDISEMISELELKESVDQYNLLSNALKTSRVDTIKDNSIASRRFLFDLNKNNLKKIMKKDCNGSYALDGQGKGIVIYGKEKCQTFKNKNYDVVSIAGVAISSKNGFKPSFTLSKSCKRTGEVSLMLSSGEAIKTNCKGIDFYVKNWIEIKF